MTMRPRVWALNAQRVELVTAGGRRPLREAGSGWFIADDALSPGERYGFSLDGGPVRPDPRSNDQPDGPHGLSRVVDQSSYRWRNDRFRARPLASAIVYEMHVGTFTGKGTLDAAADRLDHLVELGVTHVELMPICAFDGERGWGYDGVNWFAPHRAYTGASGPDAVKRFVDECHGRDLAVVLDVVYNHLGPSGNYLAEFGPYFTDAYDTPWGKAINLDGAHSDEVRRLICDSALLWLRDYRFDGLRLDAVHAFHDRSAEHIVEQIAREVHALAVAEGRPLAVIAESDLNDPRVVTPAACGGMGADAQWSDDFHHALHTLLTGEDAGYYADFGRVEDLARAFERGFVYNGRRSAFRRRAHGRTPMNIAPTRLLAYAQNHDQVGNRAAGDRLAALVDDERLRTAAMLVLLAPFTPMLFQGEEWGTARPFQYFTDHRDPALADAVRTGRRAEFAAFGWRPEDVPDPQSVETFERSTLDWSETADPRGRETLAWHRELIRLRERFTGEGGPLPVACEVEFDEARGWLVVRRGALVLAAAFGAQGARIPLERVPRWRKGVEPAMLARTSDRCALEGDSIALAPGGAVALELAAGE